mmetsp:Transcript_48348/g.151611  ORF Transcript_48348/g.151611 Transcript_48348/m.151611 type:complete len:88 (+) Transcript_48348:232-495(+)
MHKLASDWFGPSELLNNFTAHASKILPDQIRDENVFYNSLDLNFSRMTDLSTQLEGNAKIYFVLNLASTKSPRKVLCCIEYPLGTTL